jgi:hypothetical protein
VRQHRTWFSLLSYCLLLATGAALVLAIIIAGGSVALASHQGTTQALQVAGESVAPASPAPRVGKAFTGVITDSHCGARHMRYSNMTSAECARACYRNGASYVLIDGDRRYTLIGSEDALNKLLGERATVMGSRRDDHAILVDSAAPAL